MSLRNKIYFLAKVISPFRNHFEMVVYLVDPNFVYEACRAYILQKYIGYIQVFTFAYVHLSTYYLAVTILKRVEERLNS